MSSHNQFAFTICSNNYLGQANSLKESFLKHNPSFKFYIVLVDKRSDLVEYSIFEPATVITIDEIAELDVPVLISRYNIIELNTCIKPSVFKYIINNNVNAEVIYYLDPDLYFYGSLDSVNESLQTKTAALTPHILSPIPRDGKLPDENIFLNFGIFNLGFFGLNAKSENAAKLLDWWEERTINYGYNRPRIGYFVDQLWMALAPIFFEEIEVLKSFNYNMAPWNLHERHIVSVDGDKVLLNDKSHLVFYHFSKLSINDNDISREYNRYSFGDFPMLKKLYEGYRTTIEASNYTDYRKIAIGYNIKPLGAPVPKRGSFLNRTLKILSGKINALADRF
jgi:hypothetical protein